MGQNLILNMNDHGYTVVAYNRTVSKVDDFLAREAVGTKVQGAHSIEELVRKLKRPRRVMMLVKAGAAVDEFIEQLIPHLEPGDIIMSGTPAGVGPAQPGDELVAHIDGLADLRVKIVPAL